MQMLPGGKSLYTEPNSGYRGDFALLELTYAFLLPKFTIPLSRGLLLQFFLLHGTLLLISTGTSLSTEVQKMPKESLQWEINN